MRAKNLSNPVELHPVNGSKSFYGKCNMFVDSDGWKWLKSYETFVAMIDENGNFHRLWNGYSATTASHIDAFRALFNMPKLCKKQWLEIPVE